MVAEIGLWGSGVAAFVLFPLAVAAIVATPLVVAGGMISNTR
jgi:hypothetical protein